MPPNNADAINTDIDNNHIVIPNPDPGCVSSNTLNGGYIVHPAIAGPVSIKREANIIRLDKKNSQYDIIFNSPEAMSLAPI